MWKREDYGTSDFRELGGEKDIKHWVIFLLCGTIQFLIYFYSTLFFHFPLSGFGKDKKIE